MNTRQRHAVLFQALGHPVRLQILEILSQGPSCVCDLVARTDKRQPCISQHLAILRSVELVTAERQGWNICYKINPDKLAELNQFISTLFSLDRNMCSAIEKVNVR